MKKSLDRFLIAQQNYYHDAYEELKVGKKRSHWMWFIFPQIMAEGWIRNIVFSFLTTFNGIVYRHITVSETTNLGEYEPHPMASLVTYL